jgi:hypothetical protein
VVEVAPDRAVRLNASGLFEAVQLPGLKLKAPPKPPPPPVPSPAAAAAAAAPAADGSSLPKAAAAGSASDSPAVASVMPACSGKAGTAGQKEQPRAATPKLSRKAKRVLEAELSEHSDTDMSGKDTVQHIMIAINIFRTCAAKIHGIL